MDEARAVHRLDRGVHGLTMTFLDAAGEAGQAVGVRRRRADLDVIAVLVEQAVVQPLAA